MSTFRMTSLRQRVPFTFAGDLVSSEEPVIMDEQGTFMYSISFTQERLSSLRPVEQEELIHSLREQNDVSNAQYLLVLRLVLCLSCIL